MPESVWIPGARFEARVASDGRTAELFDRLHLGHLTALDAAAIRGLRAILDRLAAAMRGEGPREVEGVRFFATVGRNRKRADLNDRETVEKAVFAMMSDTDVEELRELVYVLQQHLEAAEP